MNPFDNRLFKELWFDMAKGNSEARDNLIAENPPTLDQIIDFVADVKSGKDLIEKLYFVYRTESIAGLIGWLVKPGNFGIGGVLKLDFYTKLIKATESTYKNHLFPFLPKQLQTDDLLKDYLLDKNVKDTRITNFHGDKLQTSTLEWLIDNALSTIPDWKKEWWTPELKQKAIQRESAVIAFMPPDLLDENELREFLIKDGVKNRSYMRQFWSNLSNKYRMDPEIFGRWLSLNGGLTNNYNEIKDKDYFTLEGLKWYFKVVENLGYGDWKYVKKEWKKDLIDAAMPKVMGAIAIDPDVELTDEIIDKTLKNPSNEVRKAKMLYRLFTENRLNEEYIKKIKPSFYGLDGLYEIEKNDLMKNEDVMSFIIKSRDLDLLNTKSKWPKGLKMKREYFIDIAIALEFSKPKIKARFSNIFVEDDYIWIYFESNKQDKVISKKIKLLLQFLLTEKVIKIAPEMLDLLNNSDATATYDSFKAASDIFLF